MGEKRSNGSEAGRLGLYNGSQRFRTFLYSESHRIDRISRSSFSDPQVDGYNFQMLLHPGNRDRMDFSMYLRA